MLNNANPPRAAVEVLDVWFGTAQDPFWNRQRPEWFKKDEAFDRQIRDRFGALIEQALSDRLSGWTAPHAILAHILVLDQFTRNAFRGDARSFAGDGRALVLARHLVTTGDDAALVPIQRGFAYLPFEHAEDLAMQDEAVRLFKALEAADPAQQLNRDYAERHRVIVARFGRFPHRNAILGRASTAEELAFLETPGSGF